MITNLNKKCFRIYMREVGKILAPDGIEVKNAVVKITEETIASYVDCHGTSGKLKFKGIKLAYGGEEIVTDFDKAEWLFEGSVKSDEIAAGTFSANTWYLKEPDGEIVDYELMAIILRMQCIGSE